MPPSYAFSQEGDLYIARGDRNVQRWNGLGSFTDAGVPAPSAAVTVSSSGTGTIVGSLYAYQRWLDADGRVSKLSPVSAVHTISATTGTITGATNASPIVITSASHGLSNGQTIKISGVLGNSSANGVWTVSAVTTNTFALDNSNGTGEYGSGGSWYRGASTIAYTGVTVPTDARVTRRQVLRNKDGDVKTFYIDVDDTTLSGTSFNSTNTDAQLTSSVPLIDTNGNDLNVSRHGEPPSYKRFITHYKGRLWLAGQWKYKEGSVILTNGSASVTGIGTNFTSAMVGWEFFPAAGSRSYTVTAVNTSTQVLTIEANYAGTTDAYAYYTLTPPLTSTGGGAERRTVYFSEAGLPDSWALSRGLTVPEEENSGEITGLIAYRTAVIIAHERILRRLVFASRPDSDGQVSTALYRGLVNQRCQVLVDGVLYMMDQRGIYMFAGNYDEDISKVIRPLFDGTHETWRINWRKTEYFHAAYFSDDSTVKFYVVLTGGQYPQHALCYHTRQKRWWIEEYPVPFVSSCEGSLLGKHQVFLATTGRSVLAANRGSLDGVRHDAGYTVRGTATSAGLCSITDSAASFSSSMVGLTVRIVDGTGKGQQRTINAATSTALTILEPWLIKPDTTSVYQIGGIEWNFRTGWFRWAPSTAGAQSARALEITFDPTEDASYLAMRHYRSMRRTAENMGVDRSQNNVTTAAQEPEIVVDTTTQAGTARQAITSSQSPRLYDADRMRFEVTGVPNSERQVVGEIVVEGAAK